MLTAGCHGIILIFSMKCEYITYKIYSNTSVITDIIVNNANLYIATRHWTYNCNEPECSDNACCQNEARLCLLEVGGDIIEQYVSEDHLLTHFICSCNGVVYSIATRAVKDDFISTISKISSNTIYHVCTIDMCMMSDYTRTYCTY